MSYDLYEDEDEETLEEERTSREAEATEAAQKANLARTLELRSLLKNPPMRRFMWRLLVECDIGGGFFNGDADWLLVSDGKRRVGNWVLAELEKADPTVYAQMLIEQGKTENE